MLYVTFGATRKTEQKTSKLLKMVNSAFHGLAAGKVSTVTRAVVVCIIFILIFDYFITNILI